MKVRDSGMPEAAYWESLFDIPAVLDGLQIDGRLRDVAELGCGYGTFTLPVAERIRGLVHAFDIDPAMIEATRSRAAERGIANLRLALRDVVTDGFGLAPGRVDAVLLFNILHAENPAALLRASADAVRPGGRLLAIHWRSDIPTPRGPALSIRPRPEQIADWARSAGLEPEPSVLLPPFHFGVALRRTGQVGPSPVQSS